MSAIDEQLVQRIAQQVVAALSNGGKLPAAEVRPPIGVCTASDAPPAPTRLPTQPPARVLTGFITARRLQDAGSTTVVIAADARLTPLARDYARERKLTITRGSDLSARPATQTDTPVFMTWADGACPAVAATTRRLAERLTPVRVGDNALHVAIGDLARAVSAERAAGGVLFVRSAARAACYANRCPSLRAVVGTCGEAVEQGINELGANVLIVEYPHHGAKAIDAMVERFTAAAPATPPDVAVNLKELATCA